jgi:hypothetical protein
MTFGPPDNNFNSLPASQCWGYKIAGGNEIDQEIPCPENPSFIFHLTNTNLINFSELRTLYEQYLESRTRYIFYRDRLVKELQSPTLPMFGSQRPDEGQLVKVKRYKLKDRLT